MSSKMVISKKLFMTANGPCVLGGKYLTPRKSKELLFSLTLPRSPDL